MRSTLIIIFSLLICFNIQAQIQTSSGVIKSGEIEITFVEYDNKVHSHLNVSKVDDGFNFLAGTDTGGSIFPTIQEDGKAKIFKSRQDLKNFMLKAGFSYIRTELYKEGDQIYSVMQFIR